MKDRGLTGSSERERRRLETLTGYVWEVFTLQCIFVGIGCTLVAALRQS